MSLKGMVIRCSSIIPEIREAVFRCLVCGYYSDPIVVDRGKLCGLSFYSFLSDTHCGFIIQFLLPLLIPVLTGRISEPTQCGKQECQTKNAMTLVHNRCR